MDFSGPEPADFANVTALNHAFLARLRSSSGGRTLRAHIPESLRAATKALRNRHISRLSAAPFLLMSLREHDENFWRDIELDEPMADLFAPQGDSQREIAVAAMSFIWQLARRNPYAARLVSGATPAWCERISELTLLALLQRISVAHDFLRPRFVGNDACWRKLLGPGLSSQRQVRESAYLACLQVLLTDEPHARSPRLRSAACKRPAPVMSIADRRRMR